MKRCSIGKSCGATCIERLDTCLIDLPDSIGSTLNSAAGALSTFKTPAEWASGSGSFDMDSSSMEEVIDRVMGLEAKDLREMPGVLAPGKVNWYAAVDDGSEEVGRGSFGGFATAPHKNLAPGLDRFESQGVGVKAGLISPEEVKAIRKAGEAGVGPVLIAARMESKEAPGNRYDEYGKFHLGMVAMAKVPGTSFRSGGELENYDKFFEATAALHRAGVAHNDTASRNVLMDGPNGKVRFVDFGLAQNSPKAALAEALALAQGNATDSLVQFSTPGTGLQGKVWDNWVTTVRPIMAKDGFSSSEMVIISNTGTRNTLEFYERGAFARMSDSKASSYIEALYEGI